MMRRGGGGGGGEMKTQKEEGFQGVLIKFQNRIRVGKNIATSALEESSEHNNARDMSQTFQSRVNIFVKTSSIFSNRNVFKI
jgi:hypothetical protein